MLFKKFAGSSLLKIFSIQVGLIIIAVSSISLIFAKVDAQTQIEKITRLEEICNSTGPSLTELATAVDAALASQDINRMFACGLFSSEVANHMYATGSNDLGETDYERYDFLAVHSLISALAVSQVDERDYMLRLISSAGVKSIEVRNSDALSYVFLSYVFSSHSSGEDFITVPPAYALPQTYLINNEAFSQYFQGLYYLHKDDDSSNRRRAAERISMAASIISEDRFDREDAFLEAWPAARDGFIKDIHTKNCFFGLFWSTEIESISSGFESCRQILIVNRDDKEVIARALRSLAVAEMTSYPNSEISNLAFFKLIEELEDFDRLPQDFIQHLDDCLYSLTGCSIDLLEQRFTHGAQIYEAFFLNSSLRARLKIQTALARNGFYHGAIDGLWGPLTESAIKAAARNLETHLRSPSEFTDLLFSLTPVSDDEVYAIEEQIVSQNIGSSMSNYTLGNGLRTGTPRRPSPSFMSDYTFPEVYSDGVDSGFSSIYIENRFINCYSGGGFTMCN